MKFNAFPLASGVSEKKKEIATISKVQRYGILESKRGYTCTCSIGVCTCVCVCVCDVI